MNIKFQNRFKQFDTLNTFYKFMKPSSNLYYYEHKLR